MMKRFFPPALHPKGIFLLSTKISQSLKWQAVAEGDWGEGMEGAGIDSTRDL